MSQPTESCDDCKFFQPADKPNLAGKCRRYPKQKLYYMYLNRSTGASSSLSECVYPDMYGRDWCGEFVRLTVDDMEPA